MCVSTGVLPRASLSCSPCKRQSVSPPKDHFLGGFFIKSRRTDSVDGNLLATNPPIGEALACNALKRDSSAICVAIAQRRARVVAEGKFFGIALQMLRCNVMKRPNQTALRGMMMSARRRLPPIHGMMGVAMMGSRVLIHCPGLYRWAGPWLGSLACSVVLVAVRVFVALRRSPRSFFLQSMRGGGASSSRGAADRETRSSISRCRSRSSCCRRWCLRRPALRPRGAELAGVLIGSASVR